MFQDTKQKDCKMIPNVKSNWYHQSVSNESKKKNHVYTDIGLDQGCKHKWFNLYDRSDVVSSELLSQIRFQDDFVPIEDRVFDNSDPRTCDLRLRNMLINTKE